MPEREMKWEQLLEYAFQLFDKVNEYFPNKPLSSEDWSLGGGTALMLQINHRHSYDIDIFFPDNQLLGFIIATLADVYEGLSNLKYTYLGSRHVTIKYENIGIIDCIYSVVFTDEPIKKVELAGRSINQQTVPEIICSKVVNRGWYFTPRDIFDVAAACSAIDSEQIEVALSEYPKQVLTTIKTIESIDSEFVEEQLKGLTINEKYWGLIPDSLQVTRDILKKSLDFAK